MSPPHPELDPPAAPPVRALREPVSPVWPPSRALARAVLGLLDLAPGELLLEYEPSCGGTLAGTAGWLRRRGSVRYLGIEPDPARARMLRRRHPELTIHIGMCSDVYRILDHHDLPEPRAVLLQPAVCFRPEPELEQLFAVTAGVLGRRGTLLAIASDDGRLGPSPAQLTALLAPFFPRRDLAATVAGTPAASVLLARA